MRLFRESTKRVSRILKEAGCRDFLDDDKSDSTAFHPRWLPLLKSAYQADGEAVTPCVSTSIAVEKGGAIGFCELKVEWLSDASPIELEDVTGASDKAPDFSYGLS